ncbi:MAG: calcium-binding protein [Antarcticimicrobium sp.]|uniref:calcium-binding protein n=1 Tax=Antarcticimicrobium sp. TaxID=2824147 RepID=UPI00260473EE|nr:calcium-binding protein [Antarcticimicrobium sp.]MDF1718175.1 calcium-binding protein [Antarcticimicrobium sp.]
MAIIKDTYEPGDDLANEKLVYDDADDWINSAPYNAYGLIITGGGDDVFLFGVGVDYKQTILGKGGDDTLSGGWKGSVLNGGRGDDTLSISDTSGGSRLFGGSGDDTLNLYLRVGEPEGKVTMVGNKGFDDLFLLDDGSSGARVDLGAGTVKRTYDGSFVTVARISDIEKVTGTSSYTAGDRLLGSDGNEWLDGREGNDVIQGKGGDDILIGGGGIDKLSGGPGDDLIFDSNVPGLPTSSSFEPDSIKEVLRGGGGKDVLVALNGTNKLLGGDGDDVLIGSGINDTLFGNRGDDTIKFGGVFDTNPLRYKKGSPDRFSDDEFLVGRSIERMNGVKADGGAGDDTIDFNDILVNGWIADPKTQGIVLDLATGMGEVRGASWADLSFTATKFENARGSFLGDHLTGTNGRNFLNGRDGPDVLKGLGGRDGIVGGWGNDRLFGGNGNDILIGNEGKDTLRGGAGNDDLIGGVPSDPDRSATDTFVMERGGGLDTIGDFRMTGPNSDRLDLSRWKLAGPTALETIDVTVGEIDPVLGTKSFYPGVWILPKTGFDPSDARLGVFLDGYTAAEINFDAFIF